MKVNAEGVLRHLLNFGSLSQGEVFVSDDEIYLKSGCGGVELETGISCCFDKDKAVHKINLMAVLFVGKDS